MAGPHSQDVGYGQQVVPAAEHMWKAAVFGNRMSIGLDVHARSVVGSAIDEKTSEVYRRRLSPDNREIEAWIRPIPQPWKVTYEAGSTVVAAPSKLQRPRLSPNRAAVPIATARGARIVSRSRLAEETALIPILSPHIQFEPI